MRRFRVGLAAIALSLAVGPAEAGTLPAPTPLPLDDVAMPAPAPELETLMLEVVVEERSPPPGLDPLPAVWSEPAVITAAIENAHDVSPVTDATTVVPLPPAVWLGIVGLLMVAIFGRRVV